MSDDPDVFNYTYDPDCPPGTMYGLHDHQIVQRPSAPISFSVINEIMKREYQKALSDQLYGKPLTAPTFYELCQAAAADHCLVLLNDDEYSKEWMKSYGTDEVMSIWQPLADAGYENFMVDDDEIVVRMR